MAKNAFHCPLEEEFSKIQNASDGWFQTSSIISVFIEIKVFKDVFLMEVSQMAVKKFAKLWRIYS